MPPFLFRLLTTALLGASVAAVWLLLASLPSAGHEAPTGWAYDGWCCNTKDCAPVRLDRVTATATGWRVRLEPGDHPMISHPIDVTVPYRNAQIAGQPVLRPSGDMDFHACIYPRDTVRCLYVPPMGF